VPGWNNRRGERRLENSSFRVSAILKVKCGSKVPNFGSETETFVCIVADNSSSITSCAMKAAAGLKERTVAISNGW